MMDVDSPARQQLYVELVTYCAVHAYRIGFDHLPRRPLPEILEEGTIIIKLSELCKTILPNAGDTFSHWHSYPSERISWILHLMGLTEVPLRESEPFLGRRSHVSTFLVGYDDIGAFILRTEAWKTVALPIVMGVYFDIYGHEDMLIDGYFRPCKGKEGIIESFHAAGFLDKDGYLYRWHDDIAARYIVNEGWFENGGDEYFEGPK